MMSHSFSPVLLAGIALRPLPRLPAERFVQKIAQNFSKNHPAIMERLRPIAGSRFLIEPTDLPFPVLMQIGENQLNIQLMPENNEGWHKENKQELAEDQAYDVHISGSILSLIDMLDSKADGDALFFSRKLSVEGDTEALLTLRNALDSEDINFREELLDIFGPMRTPANFIGSKLEHIFSHITQDMGKISEAITSPLTQQSNSLGAEVEDLREEVVSLKARLSKMQKNIERIAKTKPKKTTACQTTDSQKA